MENEKDMGTVVSDYAIENFKNGLNCAESVMDALVRSGALKDSPALAAGSAWQAIPVGRCPPQSWPTVRPTVGLSPGR